MRSAPKTALCALASIAFGLSGAVAQLPAGKPLEFIVGGTGGRRLQHQYARAIARYIGRHLPHKPNVVVRNLPGAGGLVATNWLFNAAPRDGSSIGALGREMPLGPLLTPNAGSYQFKALDFTWIDATAGHRPPAYQCESACATLEEMRTTPLRMSGLRARRSAGVDLPGVDQSCARDEVYCRQRISGLARGADGGRTR